MEIPRMDLNQALDYMREAVAHAKHNEESYYHHYYDEALASIEEILKEACEIK